MRFAVIVNAQLDIGAQFNAFGHATLGLARRIDADVIALRRFSDNGGCFLAEMTDHPLIALTARNGKHLMSAHEAALTAGIECNAFVTKMFEGSPEVQQSDIAASALEEMTYAALALFGDEIQLRPLTRRFSLSRG